jgi:DNA-binding XRE family transcriptional regulator
MSILPVFLNRVDNSHRIVLTNPLDYSILIVVTPDRLKTWRRNHGYTQVMLAEALGVIPLTVSRWERGVREIPSFLGLALEALECRGGDKVIRSQGAWKRKRKRR